MRRVNWKLMPNRTTNANCVHAGKKLPVHNSCWRRINVITWIECGERVLRLFCSSKILLSNEQHNESTTAASGAVNFSIHINASIQIGKQESLQTAHTLTPKAIRWMWFVYRAFLCVEAAAHTPEHEIRIHMRQRFNHFVHAAADTKLLTHARCVPLSLDSRCAAYAVFYWLF